MAPIDYRNNTWKDLQGCVHGRRLEVLLAWRKHGPCTTRELAEKTSADILNIRPRTTELQQLGFVVLVYPQPGGHEGIYRALTDEEAYDLYTQRAAASAAANAKGEAQLGLQI